MSAPVQRERLPARRRSTHYQLTLGPSTTVHLRLGYYADGRVGEVWIDLHKEGAPYRYAWHVVARQCSFALQRGVSVEEVAAGLMGGRSEPSGEVTGHESVREASSIADLMGRVLLAAAGAPGLAGVRYGTHEAGFAAVCGEWVAR